MPMPDSRVLLGDSPLPGHESIRLLALVSGLPRATLLAGSELTDDQAGEFRLLVERRLDGVPLQHLEGTVVFGPIELVCDGRALVPRPETEYLWELLVDRLGDPKVIVDVGTGSGALALALATSYPTARVIATDLDQAALALAAENAARLGLVVELVAGDLLDAVPGEIRGDVDLIASNPPYVAAADWVELPVDVRDHDPRQALVAGPTGTEVIERLVDEAWAWLSPGGLLAVEIGESQGDTVRRMAAGYRHVTIERDLAGRDRYLLAERPRD